MVAGDGYQVRSSATIAVAGRRPRTPAARAARQYDGLYAWDMGAQQRDPVWLRWLGGDGIVVPLMVELFYSTRPTPLYDEMRFMCLAKSLCLLRIKSSIPFVVHC